MGRKRKQSEEEEFFSQKPIHALVQSFCDTYEPCGSIRGADEVFTVGMIREYFSLYMIPGVEDLISVYIDALEARGFRMRTSWDGSPAIFVKLRNEQE